MEIRKIMNDTQYLLEMLGYKILDVIYGENGAENIVFANEDFMGQIIAPHRGNGYMFIVRAELKDNFDKFGNAIYEAAYEVNEFNTAAYEPITIYRELMLAYYEEYKDLCR